MKKEIFADWLTKQSEGKEIEICEDSRNLGASKIKLEIAFVGSRKITRNL